MKLISSIVAAAALLCSVNAQAALIFTESAPGGAPNGPLVFTTADAEVTSPVIGSVAGVKLAPLGLLETDQYSLITTGGVATINFGAGVSSFSFLWGSPDTYNYIDIDADGVAFDQTYGGAMLGVLANPDFTANGNNANTRVFTIAGTDGTLIRQLTFRSDGIAFEVAAAPVPLPAAAWLLLSGLAGLGFVKRRKAA